MMDIKLKLSGTSSNMWKCLLAGVAMWCLSAEAESHPLPLDFASIEWVQSTGKEWVDTGIPARFGLAFDADLMPCASVNNVCVCGAFDAANADGKYRLLLLHIFNGWFYRAGARLASAGTATKDARTTIHTEILQGSQRLVIDGEQKNASTETSDYTNLGTVNLFLFALNYGNSRADYFSQTRIYSCKITDVVNDNTVLRDFVPCRNAGGVAGLWDKVSGTFFAPNGGKLRGSDDSDTYITWIQTTATANDVGSFVDTGVPAKSGLVSDFDLAWLDKTNDRAVSGAFASTTDSTKRFLPLHIYSTQGMQWGYRYGGTFTSSGIATTTARTQIHTEMLTGSQLLSVNGIVVKTSNYAGEIDFTQTLYLFALNKVGTVDYCSSMRLYSCTMNNAVKGYTRQFRPVRLLDGRIGLADVANGNQFYAIQKKNRVDSKGKITVTAPDFTYGGVYYTLDGSVLETHEGELVDDCLVGYSRMVHVGPYTLDATGVETYSIPLEVAGGRFSLQNDAAKTVTVAGTLTLKGRAKVAIDVLPEGNDAFVVGALDLAFASAEEPVLLEVNGVGISSLAAGEVRTIISGANVAFTEADAAKFKVMGFAAQVAVRNGALVLVPVAAEEAVWSGAEGDGKWSTAGNWAANSVPAVGAGVQFNLAAGGETTCDLGNGFVVHDLRFGAEAGSFIHTGDELYVQAAISNETASAQYLPLPMSFGITGVPFEFAAVGDLTLTGGVKSVVSPALVKTGAGTLYLPDEAVAGATNVEVRAGTLKLDATGRASASAPGEIHIAAGARLDFNAQEDGVAILARSQATHEKTIYVAGDGPDGQGAIVNSPRLRIDNVYLGHLVLTGDASINGGMICCAPLAGLEVAPRVEGPHALTILNDYATGKEYVSLNDCTIELDRVNLRGCLQFSAGLTGCITNGIHAYPGGKLFLTGANLPAAMPIVVDEGTLELNVWGKAASSASAMTIPAGTAIRINTHTSTSMLYALTVSGAVTNNGLLRAEQNKMLTLSGRLVGNGVLEGASVRFSGANSCWAMEADDTGFTSKIEVTGVTDPAFLVGLKNVEIVYTGATDELKTFAIASAGNLTTAQALEMKLLVTNAQGESIPNCWLACEDGQFVVHLSDAQMVRTAVWRGMAGASLGDVANWCCSNDVEQLVGAQPMTATQVLLPDGCVVMSPDDFPFTVRKVVLPAFIGDDCDFRGIPHVVNGTLDLKGHNLWVSTLTGSGTITDTVGRGELHVDVGEAVTATNSSVALTGGLTFVKEGPGTFIAAKKMQSYTGGNVFAAGTFIPNGNADSYSYGAQGATNVVAEGAVFDLAGTKAHRLGTFVLDGGTILNDTTDSSYQMEASTFFAYVVLTKDSTFAGENYGILGLSWSKTSLALDGHRMAVDLHPDTRFFMVNTEVTGGGGIVVSNGVLRLGYVTQNTPGVNAPDVTLELVNSTLWLDADSTFGTYIPAATAVTNQVVEGTVLTLTRGFKPCDNAQLVPCKLLSGTVLDFSACTQTVPGEQLSFEAGAQIDIEVGSRTCHTGEVLMSWTEKPAGITFKRLGRGTPVWATAEGLVVGTGTVLIVR